MKTEIHTLVDSDKINLSNIAAFPEKEEKKTEERRRGTMNRNRNCEFSKKRRITRKELFEWIYRKRNAAIFL